MQINFRKQHIPWAMAAGRALLGPVIILGESARWNGIAMAWLVVTALLSDIFDGVLARRWRCDTPSARLFDSMADIVFYGCVALALWIGQPQMCRANAGWMAALLGLEAARFAVDFAKFGKPASYHSYLAKAWGLLLAIAVIAVFASHRASPLIPVALGLGIVCNLEGLGMSFVLPVWRKDVKTLRAAWQMRSEMQGDAGIERAGSAQRPIALPNKVRISAGAAILALCFVPGLSAHAIGPRAIYRGGTATIAKDTVGALDTTSPTALEFQFKKADGTAGKIEMMYERIVSIEPTEEKEQSLGILPLIAVALVVHPPQRYLVTVHYVDAQDVTQIAVFAVDRSDQRILVAVVNARTRDCYPGALQCGPALQKR